MWMYELLTYIHYYTYMRICMQYINIDIFIHSPTAYT